MTEHPVTEESIEWRAVDALAQGEDRSADLDQRVSWIRRLAAAGSDPGALRRAGRSDRVRFGHDNNAPRLPASPATQGRPGAAHTRKCAMLEGTAFV